MYGNPILRNPNKFAAVYWMTVDRAGFEGRLIGQVLWYFRKGHYAENRAGAIHEHIGPDAWGTFSDVHKAAERLLDMVRIHR